MVTYIAMLYWCFTGKTALRVAGVKSCHLPACFRCEVSRAVSAAYQWQLARPDPSPVVKSKVAPVTECGFLGFTMRGKKIRWGDKALANFKRRVRKLTGRSWG